MTQEDPLTVGRMAALLITPGLPRSAAVLIEYPDGRLVRVTDGRVEELQSGEKAVILEPEKP